ncbi:MAG: hypothetical protein ACREBC_22250 [Pyrinomonadaceae bacterium]
MATPGPKLAHVIAGRFMLSQDYKTVLDLLAEHEAMPFLELSALIHMDDERLEELIDDLEREGFVKVTSAGTPDEIITLRETAFAALASNTT